MEYSNITTCEASQISDQDSPKLTLFLCEPNSTDPPAEPPENICLFHLSHFAFFFNYYFDLCVKSPLAYKVQTRYEFIPLDLRLVGAALNHRLVRPCPHQH